MSYNPPKPCVICLNGHGNLQFPGPEGFRTDEGMFLRCGNCHEVFGPFSTADEAIEDWNMRYQEELGQMLYS